MGKKTILKKTKLPEVMPHGWKKDTASLLHIHPNTVTNALKKGKGEMYNKIMKTALEKWGI